MAIKGWWGNLGPVGAIWYVCVIWVPCLPTNHKHGVTTTTTPGPWPTCCQTQSVIDRAMHKFGIEGYSTLGTVKISPSEANEVILSHLLLEVFFDIWFASGQQQWNSRDCHDIYNFEYEDDIFPVSNIRKIFTGPTYKLFFSFKVTWGVYRCFVPNKTTFTKYYLTRWISKLIRSSPGNFNTVFLDLSKHLLTQLWPILLTWFNFNPSMDK